MNVQWKEQGALQVLMIYNYKYYQDNYKAGHQEIEI